jgi:uncharacterized protein
MSGQANPLKYNIIVPSLYGDAVLLFNTLTGSLVRIDRRSGSDVLTEDSALVSELVYTNANGGGPGQENAVTRDDQSSVSRQSNYAAEMTNLGKGSNTRSHVLSLTIATTLTCNFSCVYCFQSRSSQNMEEIDKISLLNYIEKHLTEGGLLNIMWFGGEPLMNFSFIESLNYEIYKILLQKNATCLQSIITNGSLLDRAVVDYFCAQKGFQGAQVTIDGVKHLHDERRPLLSGRGSFERIISNVAYAAKKIPVAIRVNVDRKTVDQIDALVLDLIDRGILETARMYLGHTQSLTEESKHVSEGALSVEEFAKAEISLAWSMLRQGYRPPISLPKPINGAFCIAIGDENNVAIGPGGYQFRCWNEIAMGESESVGNIVFGKGSSNSVRNARHWDNWKDKRPKSCTECAVLPLCKGGCPWIRRTTDDPESKTCSTLRYNLREKLQIFDIVQRIDSVSATSQ